MIKCFNWFNNDVQVRQDGTGFECCNCFNNGQVQPYVPVESEGPSGESGNADSSLSHSNCSSNPKYSKCIYTTICCFLFLACLSLVGIPLGVYIKNEEGGDNVPGGGDSGNNTHNLPLFPGIDGLGNATGFNIYSNNTNNTKPNKLLSDDNHNYEYQVPRDKNKNSTHQEYNHLRHSV